MIPARTAPAPGERSPSDRHVVGLLVFLSGAAALVYEVVWLRLLANVFGTTVYASTAVLVAFMGGLSLGSLVLGPWADRVTRPLRAFAVVEGGVAVWCAATPLLLAAVEGISPWLLRWSRPGCVAATVVQVGVSSMVLLPPTFLMGATLPLLARHAGRELDQPGREVARLYALNTWGAVAGTLAAGFWLVPGIGLRATVWAGVAIDLVVASCAFVLASHAVEPAAARRTEPVTKTLDAGAGGSPRRDPALRVALSALGVSGAASMVSEIAWARALAPILSSSTYAFTAVLATFLIGIATGASLAAKRVRPRHHGFFAFGATVAAAGVASLGTLPFFMWLPTLVVLALNVLGLSHGAALAVQFGGSVQVMLLPTTLLGATLPMFVVASACQPSRIGAAVGAAYATSTVGALAGAALGGLVLVPGLGPQRAVVAAASGAVLAGVAAMLAAEGPRRRAVLASVGAVQVAALLALAPAWDPRRVTTAPLAYARDYVASPAPQKSLEALVDERRVLFFDEGLNSTVMVFESGAVRSFSVNGKVDGGSSQEDMRTQVLLGHLPALLHPAPRRAFVLGLGTGMTAGALAAHGLEVVDVAELEPAVVTAASFFRAENHGVLDDPRVRVLTGDGRQLLASARSGYDIIASEPSNPWIAGMGSLFTREFYQLARSRLAPGGVMVQWFHAYSMSVPDVRMIVATFQSVFPAATIWRSARGEYLLVAREEPLALAALEMARRIEARPVVAEDLRRVLGDPATLPWLFVLGETETRSFAAGARLNTDDLPLLEFSAPRHLNRGQLDEAVDALRKSRGAEVPFAPGQRPGHVDSAAWRLHLAGVFLAQREPDDAADQLERAGPPAGLTPDLRLERVRVLEALGRLGEAETELAALREALPESQEVEGRLARIRGAVPRR